MGSGTGCFHFTLGNPGAYASHQVNRCRHVPATFESVVCSRVPFLALPWKATVIPHFPSPLLHMAGNAGSWPPKMEVARTSRAAEARGDDATYASSSVSRGERESYDDELPGFPWDHSISWDHTTQRVSRRRTPLQPIPWKAGSRAAHQPYGSPHENPTIFNARDTV